jgi:hypothetical protein
MRDGADGGANPQGAAAAVKLSVISFFNVWHLVLESSHWP